MPEHTYERVAVIKQHQKHNKRFSREKLSTQKEFNYENARDMFQNTTQLCFRKDFQVYF